MRSEQRRISVVATAFAAAYVLGAVATAEERPTAPASIHAPTPGNVVQPVRPSEPVVAAKSLFGAVTRPAPLAARAIGSYAKGCLAGAAALPVDGPAWQAMRLARNRNWGHPKLVELVQTFARDVKAKDGWPGLLVGDLSQPRGGPMLTGHASHQIGLDADIWFTPMPDRRLTNTEREEMSAVSMLRSDDITLDDKAFTPQRVQLLKRAASYPEVERVLVHPAIKKAICDATASQPVAERAWLGKVRPIWGHYYHFHIRIGCPAGSPTCKPQKDPTGDDGCGKEVADWIKLVSRPRPPPPGDAPIRQIELNQLPAECRAVLEAGR
jgi:penicillin-insensitive murein DD-endopeptidase